MEIIELIKKIGRSLYFVNLWREPMKIETYTVEKITIKADKTEIWAADDYGYFNANDIGDFIFFDKEKAEARLEKLEK